MEVERDSLIHGVLWRWEEGKRIKHCSLSTPGSTKDATEEP
jgi:hypothetical protein